MKITTTKKELINLINESYISPENFYEETLTEVEILTDDFIGKLYTIINEKFSEREEIRMLVSLVTNKINELSKL